jgi:hypothetical protein
MDDLNITVSTPEAASQLQQDFEELLARVNGDMMFISMNARDPISVEAAITSAERAIDSHASAFKHNAALLSLIPDLKQRFRAGIQGQASIEL